MPRPRKPASPFRYVNSSPEVIRLVVLMYVRFPLSLRNVEDLLFERGIDICHETVRMWWNRFGPMFAGEVRRKRVSHSYVRHGTTSLFAALDVASGFVIGKCYKRHRAAEFLDFLKQIEARVPPDLDIHIVMDNYATHKTALVRSWLARGPHYHVHFTPTSASWINQVERWFAELTRKQLRRGVHTSTAQLEKDIRAFINRHNENPKPYRWTKSADEILASVKRFCQSVDQTLCSEL